MTDWTKHTFVLTWIKDNLSAYRFLSNEAMQIKTQMAGNPLKTDADRLEFGRLYEEFLHLIECNPFTGKDETGRNASILVSDFYYFPYPTAQGIMLPVGLQIEMGAANSEEKAQMLRKRLEETAARWKQQYEAEQSQNRKLPDMGDQSEDYRLLLDRAPSAAVSRLRCLLLLVMTGYCLGGNALIYQRHLYEGYSLLYKAAFVATAAVSAVYLLKSLQWMKREKLRMAYVKAWKEARSGAAEKKEESASGVEGFRTPEAMKTVLDRIESRQYRKSSPAAAAADPGREGIRLTDLEQKKIRNRLHTAGRIHLLTMCAVLLCFCMYAGEILPERIQTFRAQLAGKLDEFLISPYLAGAATEEELNAFQEVELCLQVQENDTLTYSSAAGGQISGIFQKGSVLTFTGAEKGTSEGSVMYSFVTDSGRGYVSASSVRMIEENAVFPASIQVYDRTGAVKTINNIGELVDGRSDTFAELEQGDRIQIYFTDAVQLSSLYILNGNAATQTGGIRKGRVFFDRASEESWAVSFPAECSLNGYVIPLPEVPFQFLEIEIKEVSDTENNRCAVSELMFCLPE